MSIKFPGDERIKLYSSDITSIAYANENAVLTGCGVTEQSPQALGVTVASGKIFFGTDVIDVESTDLTITANSSGDPRIDLVLVNSSGDVSISQGIPSVLPATPDFEPDDYIVLARITVANGVSIITNDSIKDLRTLNLGGGSGSSGGGGTFGRYVEDFTSQTSVTLTHNLGDDEPLVFAYDDSGERIPIDSTVVNSINAVTITFATATTGKAVVYGGTGLSNGYYKVSISGDSSYTISHNLQNKHVNVTCYDSSDNMVEPESVSLTDENTFDIEFGTTFSGTIIVTGGIGQENYIQNVNINNKTIDYEITQEENNSVVEIDTSSGDVTVTLVGTVTTGFQCMFVNTGSNDVIFNTAGTLYSKENATKIVTQYDCATVVHKGSNSWYLFGGISI